MPSRDFAELAASCRAMIVWINGPFGVGKTTVAALVARELGARRFDPEHVGYVVRIAHRLVGADRDYQDSVAWRAATMLGVSVLDGFRRNPVVVPMTVVERAPFDATIGALRRRGHDIRHVTLVASRETLIARLIGRGPRGVWPIAQIERCLERMKGSEFDPRIDTNRIDASEVAARVVAMVRATMNT